MPFAVRAARSSCGWNPSPIRRTSPASLTAATSSGESSRSCGSAPAGVRFVTWTRRARRAAPRRRRGDRRRRRHRPRVGRVRVSARGEGGGHRAGRRSRRCKMRMILILIREAMLDDMSSASKQPPIPRPERDPEDTPAASGRRGARPRGQRRHRRAALRPAPPKRHRTSGWPPSTGRCRSSTSRAPWTRSPITPASSATGSAATSTTTTSICTSCHRVVELHDCDLEPWVKRSARRHGFTATATRSRSRACAPSAADARGALRALGSLSWGKRPVPPP